MRASPIPENDNDRLLALRDYAILDSQAEKEFDEIAALASFICKTPISTITLIDEKRQWFKAKVGLIDSETPRDVAFCGHAILQDEIMIVNDATLDERFQDNPLVTDKPDIRFYAGMPLITPEGFKLGTLCVIDTKPRNLSEEQNFSLKVLSNQVMKLFELRRKNIELNRIHEMHHRLLSIIGHDLRAPINSIDGLLLLSEKYELSVEERLAMLPRIRQIVDKTNYLLHNLLHWAKSQIEGKISERTSLNLKTISQKIIESNAHLLIAKGNKIANNINGDHNTHGDRNMIEFVFRNLILNSNKFMQGGSITIDSERKGDNLQISITDTGSGIDESRHQNIFMWGERNNTPGTNGEKGSGLGLPMSKEFIELLGGKLWVTSKVNEGTTLIFTLPASKD